MVDVASPRLGLIFSPHLPPEDLRGVAVAADASGLDDLWMSEDCFKVSGIASAAAALACTDRIRVGLGILPVPLRNVGVTAMEIATLARLFPGRLAAGVGHGVQFWMEQVGARVGSPLTLLREYVEALRALLAGESVTTQGRYVRLDAVQLEFPPNPVPPLMVAAAGPRSLALAGALGGGVMLTVVLDDAEVADACDRVTRGWSGVESNPRERPDVVLPLIVATGPGARDRVDAEVTRWGKADAEGIGVAGDAATIAAAIRRLAALGATAISVQATQDEPDLDAFIHFLGTQVRPLL